MSESYAQTWRDGALCAQVSVDLWFPEVGESTKPAKRICQRCEVRAACLADALSMPGRQDFGIRGGLSERERATLRRQLATRPPAPVVPLPTPTSPDEQPRRAA